MEKRKNRKKLYLYYLNYFDNTYGYSIFNDL